MTALALAFLDTAARPTQNEMKTSQTIHTRCEAAWRALMLLQVLLLQTGHQTII
jgi:hypothetical protein